MPSSIPRASHGLAWFNPQPPYEVLSHFTDEEAETLKAQTTFLLLDLIGGNRESPSPSHAVSKYIRGEEFKLRHFRVPCTFFSTYTLDRESPSSNCSHNFTVCLPLSHHDYGSYVFLQIPDTSLVSYPYLYLVPESKVLNTMSWRCCLPRTAFLAPSPSSAHHQWGKLLFWVDLQSWQQGLGKSLLP